jgi:hypothetical protein
MIGAGEPLSKRVGWGGGGGLIQMEITQKDIFLIQEVIGNMLIQHIGDIIEDCTPYQSAEFKSTQEIRTSD